MLQDRRETWEGLLPVELYPRMRREGSLHRWMLLLYKTHGCTFQR
jgi:hypothetical protein